MMQKRYIFCGDYIPFSQLMPQGLSDSVFVGNLECALSDNEVDSGKAYTSIIPFHRIKGNNIELFSALSLANNHIYDAGNCKDMIAELKNLFSKTQFFGIKECPYAIFDVDGERIAVIGSLEKCRSRGPLLFPEEKVLNLIGGLKGNFQKIYVYPHWGKESEYTRYPSPRQIKLAHKWIDAGADGVFGSHSHVFQGYEEYRGKPVFYSLGNFFFPHPESRLYPGTDLGMTVEITPSTGVYSPHFHRFDESGIDIIQNESEINALLNQISTNLSSWTYWKWGKEIGGFYIRKNMASWKKRMWKKFPVNFLKYLVWNIMPLTVWFRMCSIISPKTVSND